MGSRHRIFRVEKTGDAAAWAREGASHAAPAGGGAVRAEIAREPAAHEYQRLKAELELVSAAIARVRHGAAVIRAGSDARKHHLQRAVDHLDAVVSGAEQATERILGAAEMIDQAAQSLAASSSGALDRDLVDGIRAQVVRIFEACNFHDLTGQRVVKVVETMKFVESHVLRMMAISESIGADMPVRPESITAARNAALDGPRLADDSGHVSQRDIDALFS